MEGTMDLLRDTILYRVADGESLTEQLDEAFRGFEYYCELERDAYLFDDEPAAIMHRRSADEENRRIEIIHELMNEEV
jgi:hypothetical protein